MKPKEKGAANVAIEIARISGVVLAIIEAVLEEAEREVVIIRLDELEVIDGAAVDKIAEAIDEAVVDGVVIDEMTRLSRGDVVILLDIVLEAADDVEDKWIDKVVFLEISTVVPED
ncbi:hypothetical protein G6F46_008864 [Rhizopus delemar]|uniref:Uncharacterized protein n=3 Tax=Rhizopus TaxID=4842 RepID=I1CRX2_RHIO9|nr:hypothetical protein RO3G_15913 [Rhizopus delemar RA 99-880]KAG1455709.1 hypothetical protein G6F55_006919 [Rhizopus delemar]KAG1540743.1 hypothetical protein G6F51_008337 [Rhizopus arrhizus]KAG1504087.1 hypothetical protein G6F54_001248 [Rhizopus delemar]KAG1517803.1 hypothetical protein G6F53_001089 [Rhizopus delemar]|eukprot:EIE91202.1 hypothetical protein RO3G_15913 [Rhizopus delemar RA 99-880]